MRKIRILIRAHAQHCSDAIRRVRSQIVFDVFARVEFRILREIDRVPDMTMQIDHPGYDKPAGQIDFLRSSRHPDFCRRAHPADPSVIDNHRNVHRRRTPGAVDQSKVLQYLYLAVQRAGPPQKQRRGFVSHLQYGCARLVDLRPTSAAAAFPAQTLTPSLIMSTTSSALQVFRKKCGWP